MDKLQARGWIVRYINSPDERVTTDRFSIEDSPTFVIKEDGKVVDRFSGRVTRRMFWERTVGREFPLVTQVTRPPLRSNRGLGSSNSLYGPNHPYFLRRRKTDDDIPDLSALRAPPPNPFRSTPKEWSAQLQEQIGNALIGVNHPLYRRDQDQLEPQQETQIKQERLAKSNTIAQPLSVSELYSEDLARLPPAPDIRAATVRIRVKTDESYSVGTGTIIFTFLDEALVLTCRHLFETDQASQEIEIDSFDGSKSQTIRGEVVEFPIRSDVDLALVRIRPSSRLPTIPIIPRTSRLSEGMPVFSLGCDQGSNPSRRNTVVSRINRFLGPANVEIAGAPIQGRSGGGLFNSQGQLVGVCYAADPDLDEGIYVGPAAIQQLLEDVKLGFLPEIANKKSNRANR